MFREKAISIYILPVKLSRIFGITALMLSTTDHDTNNILY